MKLHLPVFLRKSLLSCLAAFIVCTVGSGVAWAETLSFEDESLTWDTQTESFVNEEGNAAAFTAGDNVSFIGESTVTLGEDISAGTVAIEQGADVTIDLDVYELNVDRIELSGLLDMGYSLHIGEGTTLAVQSAGAVLDSNLVLGDKGGFEVGAAASLNNNLLTLQGNTSFTLTAAGDGKTYTLLTGVSGLLDAQGNAISLDDTNNAASRYFDATQPGSGFWANGTLQLNHGALQMVLHNETVKDAITITTWQENPSAYQYYAGVSFENIEYVSGSYYAYGGAIYGGYGSTITLSDNGSVSFSGNTAESASSSASPSSLAYGGAIYGHYYSTITLSDNGSVVFEGNTASAYSSSYYSALASGGAIYGGSYSTITLSNNESVSFSGNTAESASSSYYYNNYARGGENSTITLSNNGSVVFEGNTASASYYARGGAIYGGSYSTITLSNNGSVTFSGNTAESASSSAYGGAIYGDWYSTITLSNNGSVTFSGNTASGSDYVYGGAIYTEGNLSIQNNDSVEFYQNAEVKGGVYRLRSIYAGGSGDVISLSAAAGKSITFRDSIYIGSGNTFKLNEAYEGMPQQGDIIFTGATTVDDLYAVKGNIAGTEEEIINSRTTEVYALTELHGGRLRVEEGAVYKGNGITAMEDSSATVRVQNATLSHEGYELRFNAGTSLEVAGNSTIRGNVNLLADSLFKLEKAASLSLHETLEADAAELTVHGTALLAGSATLNASLTLADGATLDMMSLDAGAVTLNGALTFGAQVEMGENLMAILNEMRGWEESVTLFTGIESLVLPQVVTSGDPGRVWVGNVFSNLAGNESYYIDFKADVGALLVVHVPEPTTTSLSLLVLAAFAARRRRG